MPDIDLPANAVAMERAIARAIVNILLTVPDVGHVYAEEPHPSTGSSEDETQLTTDEKIETVPDPVIGESLRVTNIITLGTPTVSTVPGTCDNAPILTFMYPMTFDLGICTEDRWANRPSDWPFKYKNSAQWFIGTFMLALVRFANNRTLGFNNTEHQYLQQVQAGEVIDPDSGEALNHSADWILEVRVAYKRLLIN